MMTPVAVPTLRAERELFASGAPIVLACDEVGRGALAGPVSVGMVVIDASVKRMPAGLRDSKLLPEPRREAIAPRAAAWVRAWAVGEASAAEIERSTSAARPSTVVTPISAPPSVRMPVRSNSACRPSPLSPPEARSPAVSMRFRLCSPLWPTQLGLDLTAALDREADDIRLRASGHGSACVVRSCVVRRPTAGLEVGLQRPLQCPLRTSDRCIA